MSPIEAIEQTGVLPNKFKTAGGRQFELFLRKKFNGKGYIASYWEMIDGIQDRIFLSGDGITINEAKDKLKQKLTHP